MSTHILEENAECRLQVLVNLIIRVHWSMRYVYELDGMRRRHLDGQYPTKLSRLGRLRASFELDSRPRVPTHECLQKAPSIKCFGGSQVTSQHTFFGSAFTRQSVKSARARLGRIPSVEYTDPTTLLRTAML